MTYPAFWLAPDWRGGDNLRDPGTTAFWMREPLPYVPQREVNVMRRHGTVTYIGYCSRCGRERMYTGDAMTETYVCMSCSKKRHKIE